MKPSDHIRVISLEAVEPGTFFLVGEPRQIGALPPTRQVLVCKNVGKPRLSEPLQEISIYNQKERP